MKTKIAQLLTLLFLISLSGIMTEYSLAARIQDQQDIHVSIANRERMEPDYSFTIAPQVLRASYYDYFMASYNTLPLRVVSPAHGGGYLLTYHSRESITQNRRAYWARISGGGTVGPNTTINNVITQDGFPTMIYDEVYGIIFTAWHANMDSDSANEIVLTMSMINGGLVDMMTGPEIVIDAPYTLNGFNDNVFLWSQLAIGSSPNANYRRVYLMGTNSISHTAFPSFNVLIAYADFNSMGYSPSGWSYTSIPELDTWSIDNNTSKRTFLSLNADDNGRVYVSGYHQNDGITIGPELHVFLNENHGAGNWRRISANSAMPVWMPMVNGTPWLGNSDEIDFKIGNSTHLNAALDEQNRLHVSGVWVLSDADGSYYPNFQFIKEFIYDPLTDQISLKEVFPVSANPNAAFTPWDILPPWNEVDQIMPSGYPFAFTYLPYCHWDTTLHSNAMMFHYNNVKTTLANEMGMMACVWQDTISCAALNSSRINIALSSNNGDTWSDPIRIDAHNDSELADHIPMWVSPADKIIFSGYHNGKPRGKLGLVYFDDTFWGSEILDSVMLQGGNVIFTELEVLCPPIPMPTGSFNLQVINDLDETVPDAEVRIGDLMFTTDANGMINIPEIGFSTWDLNISMFGYYDYDTIIHILENQALNLTVTLQPLPPVTMIGWVQANDMPTDGFPGVSITLQSPYYYETSSEVSGYFSIPDLRAGTTYSLVLQAPGYSPFQCSGRVEEEDFLLPIITLIEIIAAPQEVLAELQLPSTVLISWDDSSLSTKSDPKVALQQRSTQGNGDRYISGYNIYLIPEEDLSNQANWILLHSGILDQDQYAYEQWQSLSPGTYFWGVKRCYNTGEISSAGISNPLVRPTGVEDNLLTAYETGFQNIYPNPFNPETKISFALKDSGFASLVVYNIKGQKVKELVKSDLNRGLHQLVWNGRDDMDHAVSSGIYHLILKQGKSRKIARVVLLK